eukprot:m.97502 g.97502  ORF g.97502 m.97502 type:complete len:164 (+) comp16704_c0_seq1:249-740(+)
MLKQNYLFFWTSHGRKPLEYQRFLGPLLKTSVFNGDTAGIEAAMAMKQVSKDMGFVCKGLDKAMASMDLEKMMGIMDKFEAQVENLETMDGVMQQGLASTTASTVSSDAVDDLLSEMMDDAAQELEAAPAPALGSAQPAESVSELDPAEEASLTRRLAALRSM